MYEEISLGAGLLRIIGVVLLYYAGTRGIFLATRHYAGRWHRRAAVSLSLAVLFAPSLMGIGHGGIVPVPAWVAGLEYARAEVWEGALKAGIAPIAVTWVVFFAAATLSARMSKNNNKKVDTHGEDQ